MATAATFQRSAPLRTRLPLLALAWIGVLTLALAPADGVQARSAHGAPPGPVSTPAVAALLRTPSPEVDIDAALPAISEPSATPAQAAQRAAARIAPPVPVEAAFPPATAETVNSVPAPERQAQQFAVTAALPVPVATAGAAPAVAAGISMPLPPVTAKPAPAAVVASNPVAAPPTLSGREQRLFEAINAQRAQAGIPALVSNATLMQAARSRSQDMVTNNYFAHVGPRGQSWYTALAAVGWSMSGGGENLAKVAGDEHASVADAIQRLMASPTHRANIVSQNFRLVGIGAVVDAAGVTIFTTIFTDR